MLERLGRIAATLTGLLGTEARLVTRDLEQAGLNAVWHLVAGLCALLGLAALLASLAIVLAALTNVPAALAIIGVIAFGAAGLVIFLLHTPDRDARATRGRLDERATIHTRELADDEPAPSPTESPAFRDDEVAAAADVLRFVSDHPHAVASGAFAAIAILGPRRALRVLSRATEAAGTVASITRIARDMAVEQAANPPPDSAPSDPVHDPASHCHGNGARIHGWKR